MGCRGGGLGLRFVKATLFLGTNERLLGYCCFCVEALDTWCCSPSCLPLSSRILVVECLARCRVRGFCYGCCTVHLQKDTSRVGFAIRGHSQISATKNLLHVTNTEPGHYF